MNIITYDCLESTNTTAKELAVAGAEHGTVVIAEQQTGGKGRYNRNFFSPQGHGIYMSVILRKLQYSIQNPTLVTVHAAVAVCEAIEILTGKSPLIKWVNDIILGEKKICGILTESGIIAASNSYENAEVGRNNYNRWFVVGIGINFITPSDGFPEEIRDTAGALFFSDDKKITVTRNQLAIQVADRMLGKTSSESLLVEYKKRLVMLGKRITVYGSEFNNSFEAVAINIDDIGRLIVKKDNGEILSLCSGEVSLSRPFP